MADINAIAKQFTDFYYQTFDSNRAGLQALYVRIIFNIYAINQLKTHCNPARYFHVDMGRPADPKCCSNL